MNAVTDATLFGKYELRRVLGRGRSGTVYLAWHKDLEEYRAIKQVPKACADYSQFRKEALILKDIRHPGIPVVYDLEEDEDYSYLIEEFLEGDSLYALVSGTGHLSRAMTISYGIQICRLVTILHSAKPTPVLYLDLQPKNLLVCHDTVKLVDFDHAVHLSEAESLKKRYGTVGFAAPEQYTGDVLDERTDIYAIGAVLYYMMTGMFPGEHPKYPREWIDRSMAKIIRTCLQREPHRRYASVVRLCEVLEGLEKQSGVWSQCGFWEKGISSLIIAVAGAAAGVGTTHTALGFAAWLQKCGLPALYEEKNESGAVMQYVSCTGGIADRCGIVRIRGLPVLASYGPAVHLASHPYRVVVRDCGVAEKNFREESADIHLLVCGSRPWEWKQSQQAVYAQKDIPGVMIIYNHWCKTVCSRLAVPPKGIPCFLLPCGKDPWRPDKQTERVYTAIWREMTGSSPKRMVRRWIGKGTGYLKGMVWNHPGGRWGSQEQEGQSEPRI